MPKFRISSEGIEIARPGYNVDTATPDQIAFSSKFPALRLYDTGLVEMVRYSGPLSDRFARGVVTYSVPFSKAPLVLVAGVISGTESDQLPGAVASSFAGTRWSWYSIASYPDRFELYGYDRHLSGNPQTRPTRTYRYFVFHNTLDDT